MNIALLDEDDNAIIVMPAEIANSLTTQLFFVHGIKLRACNTNSATDVDNLEDCLKIVARVAAQFNENGDDEDAKPLQF